MLALEVFGTPENLQDFAALRTKYLFAVLEQVLRSTRDIAEVSEEKKEQLLQITSVAHASDEFQTFVVFDSIQFAASWAREWCQLLTRATSVDNMVECIKSMKTVATDDPQPEQTRFRLQKAATEKGLHAGDQEKESKDEKKEDQADEQGGLGNRIRKWNINMIQELRNCILCFSS